MNGSLPLCRQAPEWIRRICFSVSDPKGPTLPLPFTAVFFMPGIAYGPISLAYWCSFILVILPKIWALIEAALGPLAKDSETDF